MADVLATESSLFGVPFWRRSCDEVVPYHDEMVADVEANLAEHGTSPSDLAHQTLEDPFSGRSDGWRILEEMMNSLYRSVIEERFRRWRSGELHLRRWAIKIGDLDLDETRRLGAGAIHNHAPALLSSIYYLRVPAELSSAASGGTHFYNPIAGAVDNLVPRGHDEPPIEGRLVVFPSFVDHAPLPLHWSAPDDPRIVISADVYYTSGTAVGRVSSLPG